MSGVFIVRPTDPDIDPSTGRPYYFTIEPGRINGPTGFQRSSDLRLYGDGSYRWGEGFNNNFYRLLETSACEAKELGDHLPEFLWNSTRIAGYDENNSSTFPTIPNTLYDPSIDVLLPKDEQDLNGVGLGITTYVKGQLWFNKSNNTLYVYNGTTWQVTTNAGGDYANIKIDSTSGGAGVILHNTDWTALAQRDDEVFSVEFSETDPGELGTMEKIFTIGTDGVLYFDGITGSVDVANGDIRLSSATAPHGDCVMTKNLTATAIDDALTTTATDTFNFSGHTVSGLSPGAKYHVTVYGKSDNKGTSTGTVYGQIKVVDAAFPSSILAVAPALTAVYWPNGHIPMTCSFVIVAPLSGAITGYVDNDNLASFMSGFYIAGT